MKRLKVSLFKNKKRRNIVAVSLVGVLVVVGGTIAYNTDASFFQNLFRLNRDIVTHTEDIPFPLTNWVPCEEKEKYITVTNVEGVDKYVRIKFRDAWKTADDQTDLSSVKDGVTLATINFANNWENYWELRDDGYYYYKTVVAKGASTQPLLKSVTLSCDADFGADNVCTETATGVSCTKPSDPYEGAKYHLYIDIDTSTEPMGEAPHVVDCESNNIYDKVACQAAETPASIDFRYPAQVSSTPSVANGNGVNATTENGSTVYYYRGQIDNNYVIWANKCWRLLRTTATGGTKMIYYGIPDNGVCPDGDWTWDDQIYGIDGVDSWGYNRNNFEWSGKAEDEYDCAYKLQGECYDSLADMGYMFGDRQALHLYDSSATLPGNKLYGNDVNYSGGVYTLVDTVEGNWSNTNFLHEQIAGTHHYVCLDGSASCSAVAYVAQSTYHLLLSNGDTIETIITKMTSNLEDSIVKQNVDAFYASNLVSFGDDLEDAVYCNDRSIYGGPMKGKDYPLIGRFEWDPNSYYGNYDYDRYYGALFNAWMRNAKDVDNNFHPSLDCSKNDSFTVGDAGNGALTYKIGLITADEATLAGINTNWRDGEADNNFMGAINSSYTLSPIGFDVYARSIHGHVCQGGRNLTTCDGYPFDDGDGYGLHPVVSLKQSKTYSSGTGTRTDPYIVN